MRLTLTVDTERFEVEADADAAWVEVGGRRFTVKLLSTGPDKVELEIGGERAVVAAWPSGTSEPPAGVSVNGELVRVEIARQPTAGPPSPRRPTPMPVAPGVTPPPASIDAGGPGLAVIPPMPGKILEVRVRDGEAVAAGQLLLVLEAMKMRNEITSPSAGTVQGLSVAPGQSVRAREVLLRIVAG